MTEATRTSAVDAARTIVQDRFFDAPPALVYQAWTDPDHLPHWFGPKGFTITNKTLDVRVGGTWEFVMHGPDGKDWPNFVRFTEIVKDERLAYDHGESLNGAAHFHVTITFTPEAAGTRMRMESLFPNAEAAEAVKKFGAVELGAQTLDKLAERLKTMGLSLTRTFDAPRELVYQVWSEAKHLGHWWGPKGMELDIVKLDFRPGGMMLYRNRNEQMEMWGKFAYVDMQAPERIVFISSFSDAEGNTTRAPFAADFPLEVYNVLTLTERDGKTTLNLAGGPLNPTAAESAFYANMNASMQQGFKGTFDQLEAYLAEAQK